MSAPAGLREHWGGVLGVAFGLLLIAGLVAAIATHKASAEDPRALLDEWFAVESAQGELPSGLRVEAAATLSDGRRTVRLVDPAAPPEEPEESAEPAQSGEPGPDAATPSASRADDPAPAVREGSAPREVMLVEYPRARAPAELRRLFFSSSGGFGPGGGGRGGPPGAGSGMGDGRGGGERTVVMERDELAWGRFAARFVHERKIGKGGGFHDTLRVNLSHEDTALVLFARWTRGHAASRERIEELLGALRPR